MKVPTLSTQSPTLQGARRSTIFLIIFLDVFTYGMIAPLLPFFVLRYDGGALLAGLLGSLYAVMQLISGPVLGPLSDRFGRRVVLLACLVGTLAAYSLLGFGQSLVFLFLAILLDGLTGGNLTTAQAYVSDITSDAQRAHGIGLVGAMMGLGMMTGPAVGGLLAAGDLYWPALAGCGVASLNILIGTFWLPESLPPERRASQLKLTSLHLGAQLTETFRQPRLPALLITLFALNLSFAGLQSNFPLYSQERFGWNASQNGLFFAFVGVCAVITQGVLVGKLAPRLGERRLAGWGLVMLTVTLVGVALASQAWQLFPLVGLAALGSGLSIPSLSSLISQTAPLTRQGRVLGGMQSLLSLAAIIGPALAGLSFEGLGSAAPYWMGGLFAMLALLNHTISQKHKHTT
jgi:MFS family permease